MAKRNWLIIVTLVCAWTMAQAGEPAPTNDEALALLNAGKRGEALHAFEAIIAAHPSDPGQALFAASMIHLEDGDWHSARPLVRRLVKLRPSSFPAWELMVQADQAANDLQDRKAAIRSLYAAWRSALDPAVQARVAFTRDRIFGDKHVLLARETLDPGGDDIVRFVFQPAEEAGNPRHIMIVRADNETNMRWREAGTVPFNTIVYHLDTIERLPNGRQRITPYQYYLEAPDYDKVRPLVVSILSGEAKPLSGDPDPYWAGDVSTP